MIPGMGYVVMGQVESMKSTGQKKHWLAGIVCPLEPMVWQSQGKRPVAPQRTLPAVFPVATAPSMIFRALHVPGRSFRGALGCSSHLASAGEGCQ